MGAIHREDYPLVILARRDPETSVLLKEAVEALEKDGKDCRVASNSSELFQALKSSRCFCVFLWDDFSDDAVQPLRTGRQAGPAEWFLVAEEGDKNLHYRALEAGAKAILAKPLTNYQFVQRARQALAGFQSVSARGVHVDYRRGGALDTVPLVGATTEPAQPLDGVEIVRGSTSYVPRRPEWGVIGQSMRSRPFVGLNAYRAGCEKDLTTIARSEPTATLSLVSIRIKDPIEAMPPARVKTIVSTGAAPRLGVHSIDEMPEVKAALALDRTVAVANVRQSPRYGAFLSKDLETRGIVSRAAIPLRWNGQVVGVVAVDFTTALDGARRDYLEDLVPLSEAFAAPFSKIEFLSRVYEAGGFR